LIVAGQTNLVTRSAVNSQSGEHGNVPDAADPWAAVIA